MARQLAENRLHIGPVLPQQHRDVVLVVLDPLEFSLTVKRRQGKQLQKEQPFHRRTDDLPLHKLLALRMLAAHEIEEPEIAQQKIDLQPAKLTACK